MHREDTASNSAVDLHNAHILLLLPCSPNEQVEKSSGPHFTTVRAEALWGGGGGGQMGPSLMEPIVSSAGGYQWRKVSKRSKAIRGCSLEEVTFFSLL